MSAKSLHVVIILFSFMMLLPLQVVARNATVDLADLAQGGDSHILIFAANVDTDLREQTVSRLLSYYGKDNVLSWTENDERFGLQYLYAYPTSGDDLMDDIAPRGILTSQSASRADIKNNFFGGGTVCPSLHKDNYYQGQKVRFCVVVGSGTAAGSTNLANQGFNNVASSNLMPYGVNTCAFWLYDSTNYNNHLSTRYSNTSIFSSSYNNKTTSAWVLC